MLYLADVQPDEVLYDLGCGDGRFIVKTARKHGAKAVGFDITPFLYLWCQLKITLYGLRKIVKVKFGILFKRNLSNADAVKCYLLQEKNDKLETKMIEELKPTARIISKTFMFRNLLVISEDKDKGI